MRRWWIALFALIFLTFVQIMAGQVNDIFGWLTLVIATLFLWVPATIIVVLCPRLRGFVVIVFLFVSLSRLVDLDALPTHWMFGGLLIAWLAVFFLFQRIKTVSRFSGRTVINKPVAEVAEIIRYRPTDTFWQRNIDRIEAHPEAPGQWRCFLLPPLSKHLEYYDAEVLEADATGGFSARVLGADPKIWEGSEYRVTLEARAGQTVVRQDETSRVNLLAALSLWFDRAGHDNLEQLRTYAEGLPDWSIGAGSGRWWPTWRPAPDAAVF